MNRSQAMPVIVALVSIAALGLAATTLDTALTTDPDEEINPNWDLLPIGETDAAAVEEEIAASADGSDQTESTTTLDDKSPDPDPESAPPTVYDRLLNLISTLLESVVVLAVLAGVAAFGYYHRSALGSAVETQQSNEPPAKPDSKPWPEAEPTNVVDRAWLQLVQTLEPEVPETTTPAECLQQAREQGLDMEATEAIITAFERVQYGGRPVEAEADRAQVGLEQLTGGAE